MNQNIYYLILFVLVVIISITITETAKSQGFLRAEDTQIVNDDGEILLRGMGLGGWMLQEGYMLKTEQFANPQHEIRERIEDLIGEEKTDEFYDAWLENHFTKEDADALAGMGFNNIRVPVHYNLFTLPVEEEPVEGEQTWLDTGFEMLDELLEWCIENELYMIIDLHAAPGGQGEDAAISDYDPSKPSLWESEANKEKTIALWRKLAERYEDEQWIGGFDLINEVNWDFDEPDNEPMWELYRDITEAIREVNDNHMVIIGGNWWGNDYTGLDEPFDDNLVYSFHKYWNENTQSSIQEFIDLGQSHNVPIWMGEAGENSNVWFTEAISLLEENDIGWAWWSWKKFDTITGSVSVPLTEDYQTLLDFWRDGGTTPSGDITAEFAENTLMEMTEMLKLENSEINTDVIDAMFRQVETAETKPFADHSLPGHIAATDFDYGRINQAYFDHTEATYHVTTGQHTPWNNGWSYRNDAVDIEESSDDSDKSNGFNIGWTEPGEWMQYTTEVEETAVYELNLRYAGMNPDTQVFFQINGEDITGAIDLPSTGGWQNWEYKTAGQEIILHEGTQSIGLHTQQQGANYGYFEFNKISTDPASVEFTYVSSEVNEDGRSIQLILNNDIQSPVEYGDDDFTITADGRDIGVEQVHFNESEKRTLVLDLESRVYGGMSLEISYSGDQITNIYGATLEPFSDKNVKNELYEPHSIPGRIQAQAWVEQSGLSLEEVNDESGEYNFGFTNDGDFADYLIHVGENDDYYVSFRVATIRDTGIIQLQTVDEQGNETVLSSFDVPNTGGWQSWETITGNVSLSEGYHRLRLYIEQAEFNVNWFEFDTEDPTSGEQESSEIPLETTLEKNYPNPFNPSTQIRFGLEESGPVQLVVYDVLGRRVATILDESLNSGWHEVSFNASNLSSGLYVYHLQTEKSTHSRKMMFLK